MLAWWLLQMEWWSAGCCLALAGASSLVVRRVVARWNCRARARAGGLWEWTERERLERGVTLPSDRVEMAQWRVLM